MFEALNRNLFLLMNAPSHPGGLMLAFSTAFAQDVIFIVPVYLLFGWLLSTQDETKKIMFSAVLSGLLALLFAQVIGYIWPHPRPFMVGLGTSFLAHVADSSFPSDHVTLMAAVAFSLISSSLTRTFGVALMLIGVVVAWSRIYLGVHFPFDMAGAFLVGLGSAWLVGRMPKVIFDPAYAHLVKLYRKLFSGLIRGGWIY
ncbi:MAG: phosphatase PAP2 family protein [Burkholderiaceae bacterium]